MKTMTIRNIPDGLANRLARKSREERRSINSAAIDALMNGLGDKVKTRPCFASFCGRWTADEAAEFDATQVVFNSVNSEDWE